MLRVIWNKCRVLRLQKRRERKHYWALIWENSWIKRLELSFKEVEKVRTMQWAKELNTTTTCSMHSDHVIRVATWFIRNFVLIGWSGPSIVILCRHSVECWQAKRPGNVKTNIACSKWAYNYELSLFKMLVDYIFRL